MEVPPAEKKASQDRSADAIEVVPDTSGVQLDALLIGDDEDVAEAVLHELARGGATLRHVLVHSVPGVVKALDERLWDVVIFDQATRRVSAVEVLDHLGATGADIPLLIVSGTPEASSAVAAMAHGAKDYVLMSSLFRLLPAVLRELNAAELRRGQREGMRLNQAMNEIRTVIHSSFDAHETLQRALDEARLALAADSGVIQLRQGDRWVVRFQSGLADDRLGDSFSDDEMYVVPQILGTMTPAVIDDLQADPNYDHELFDLYAARSTIAVPLTLRNELIGLLFLSKASTPSGFTPETVEFGRNLGAAVSLAIQNADAMQREREYAGLSDTLSRINEILLEPFDPVATMGKVVAQARELFDADNARIIERSDGDWVFAHTVGKSPPASGAGHVPAQASLRFMQPALGAAESVFAEDLGEVSDPAAYPYRASIALPLVVGDRVVAVLALGFAHPRTFSVRDRQFAERLRSAVSLALENEERLREESSIATLADALERAESGIYAARDEGGVVALVLKTATVALCATGACGVWCDRKELVTVASVPRVASVDLDSEPALSKLVDRACSLDRGTRGHPTVGVLPKTFDDCELLAMILPTASDRLALILERRGGDFGFKKEELSFAERLVEVAGLAMRNVRLMRERESLVSTREEWLAGISHDLRTPLAAVRGYAELLAAGGDTGIADVRDQSQRILEQTDRIERMIVDMLLAFRIRANALPVTAEIVPLRPLLEDVRRTVLADRRSRGRRIEVGMATDLAAVADPTLLERALANLAMNAVVHNAPGVRVSLWAAERDGRSVVQVTDDGRGIDAATMKRLFVRYHRASASGEGAAGAGLGMPIARQLIESMGGTLEVESAEGLGTTATITLPLAAG